MTTMTTSKPRYVIVDARGRYYHFWDKACYGEPQFGDLYNAKVSTASGVATTIRMLARAGYVVTRELVTTLSILKN